MKWKSALADRRKTPPQRDAPRLPAFVERVQLAVLQRCFNGPSTSLGPTFGPQVLNSLRSPRQWRGTRGDSQDIIICCRIRFATAQLGGFVLSGTGARIGRSVLAVKRTLVPRLLLQRQFFDLDRAEFDL